MLQRSGIPLLLVALAALPAVLVAQASMNSASQPSGSSSPVSSPTANLRQALARVQSTMEGLEIRHWKTSRGIRRQTQDNVESIQQDLSQTLPGLMAAADAAPDSVPPAFTVYRNVDALYDVLLRVSAAADFAAPRGDAEAIAAALQQLESARSGLANAILQASKEHEAQIREFSLALRAARAAAAAPPKETVIDDGPASSSRTRGRRVAHHEYKDKAKAAAPKS